MQLSEVLDYILYRSQQSSVNLNEEVAVINIFLELEKLRLGNKLDVTLRTEGTMSAKVAPLTLLSLVENTLKENIINDSNQLTVDILVTSEHENVNCDISVKDKNNLKLRTNELTEYHRQLSLTYPNTHSLTQKKVGGSIVTSLSLNIAV